jgi:hypothetical protein
MVFAAAFLAFAGPAPRASAQDALGASSTALFNACVNNAQGGSTECACMAGFYGGRLAEDEFRILAALNPHISATGEVPDMNAAHQSMFAARDSMGMSDERFDEVMQRFSSMNIDGAYGDRICVALRDK